MNVLMLEKPNGEKYIIIFDDKNKTKAIWHMIEMASNSDLNFTWLDASRMSEKVRLSDFESCE